MAQKSFWLFFFCWWRNPSDPPGWWQMSNFFFFFEGFPKTPTRYNIISLYISLCSGWNLINMIATSMPFFCGSEQIFSVFFVEYFLYIGSCNILHEQTQAVFGSIDLFDSFFLFCFPLDSQFSFYLSSKEFYSYPSKSRVYNYHKKHVKADRCIKIPIKPTLKCFKIQ